MTENEKFDVVVETRLLKQKVETFIDSHQKDALRRHESLTSTLEVILKKIDCQNTRCFEHAPIIDSFQKHTIDHVSAKKEGEQKRRAYIIALGGWALAIIEIGIRFFSKG
jgi:hypothetical protein